MCWDWVPYPSSPCGAPSAGKRGSTMQTQHLTPAVSKACCCRCLVSCVWHSVTPWTIACQAPLSTGLPRQEYGSGQPFYSPGNLPNPGIEPGSLGLQVDSLPSESPGKPFIFRRFKDKDRLIALALDWIPQKEVTANMQSHSPTLSSADNRASQVAKATLADQQMNTSLYTCGHRRPSRA